MKAVRLLSFSLFGSLCVTGCNDSKSANSSKTQTNDSKQLASSPGRQDIDLGKEQKVPWSAIRNEAKAPVSFSDEASFQARLKSGGTVSLSESDMVLGEPDYGKSNPQFLALDVLELKKGARIVTGGNNLVIFANKIVSEDGGIVAMTDKTMNAASATVAGGSGSPGVSGGTVTLIAVNGIEGRLHANLSGQNGGNGFKGVTGPQGAAGLKGDNAVMQYGIPTYCKSGGQDGQAGHKGGNGVKGGSGGNGGQGGFLGIYNIGSAPVPSASWDFVAEAGKGGTPGAGGEGGLGGPGGEGGNGDGLCGGGRAANAGPQGDPGPSGDPGLVPAKGSSISKNVDLEFVVKTTKVIPINH